MNTTESDNPILPAAEKPDWLEYPLELFELVQSGRMPLIPWHFVSADGAAYYHQREKSRLGRHLVVMTVKTWPASNEEKGIRC